jgi:hypothetical protein
VTPNRFAKAHALLNSRPFPGFSENPFELFAKNLFGKNRGWADRESRTAVPETLRDARGGVVSRPRQSTASAITGYSLIGDHRGEGVI